MQQHTHVSSSRSFIASRMDYDADRIYGVVVNNCDFTPDFTPIHRILTPQRRCVPQPGARLLRKMGRFAHAPFPAQAIILSLFCAAGWTGTGGLGKDGTGTTSVPDMNPTLERARAAGLKLQQEVVHSRPGWSLAR